MKKVQYTAFGGLDVLTLAEVNQPVAGPRQVLVRVKAAAINPIDWKMRVGQVKFLSGYREAYEQAAAGRFLGKAVFTMTPE